MPVRGPAQWYLLVYGALAVAHLLAQYTFALLHGVRLRWAEYARLKQTVPKAEKFSVWRLLFQGKLPGRMRTVPKAPPVEGKHRRLSAPVPGSLAVWVPVFNEKLNWLYECLKALQTAAARFEGEMKVIVIDDGSYQKQLARYRQPQPKLSRLHRFWYEVRGKKPEDYAERYAYYLRKRKELEDLLKVFERDPRFEIILSPNNVGKRHVQQIAWRHSTGYELYGTVDSDTIVDKDAFELLIQNFRNPDVAAATGYVDVGNWDENWLTRLIDMRYWSAFHVERAAQSFFKAVMCCSGPLAVYRATVLDEFMGRYATQRFNDEWCTFGDDRHLTNLCLARGYLVVFDPRAHCLTEVPTTLGQYRVQQTRWNKSFYREMLWSLQALGTHSLYMTWDLTMQFVLPFMLLGGLGVTAYLAVVGDAYGTVRLYVATIFVVGFARSLYPFFGRRNISWGRRFGQLLFIGYGVVHICVLTPVRIWALIELSMNRTGWGTRTG